MVDEIVDEKALISLVSVGVGWLLAQGTTLVRECYTTWKLKRGLVHELEDLQEQLRRMIMSYQRQLQVYSLRGIEPSAPIGVPNLLFKQYYKDVFSSLNRKQRLSYQLIHGQLDSLNTLNNDFLTFTSKTVDELRHSKNPGEIQRAVDLWGDRVIALHELAMTTMWHVESHLRNRRSPATDLMGPMHKSYLQFLSEVEQETKKIMDGAKAIKREEFASIYDEKYFRKQ